MSEQTTTKRIAKNTLMLYFRQILIMIVSLYTVRVVLNTLGAEDYGIYNVVAGVVTMFSFLSSSMATASQRYFSFALGENNEDKLNKTFSTNLIIYILIALIAFVLLESVGTWFINNKLKVPNERFDAACWIFHLSIITFIFSVITSPFMAIIIAHEDMQIYAYVSIVEVFMKLLIVFLLNFIAWDKLKLYSCLLCCIGLINMSIYIFICKKKYKECQFKYFYWDKNLFKETLNFTGWTLFGSVSSVVRSQAVTILINQVFNPLVVTARSIATQVSNHINVFSSGFNTSLYPPIVKSYALGNKTEMHRLIFIGCKMTFFLLWIFALPLFLEMDLVLSIWLKTPPQSSILFTRLALIEVLINAISLPIMTAARAPGKMRTYELSLGSIQFLIFAVDYVLFKHFHMQAYVVFIVAAIGNTVMFLLRLVIVRGLIALSLKKFLSNVLIPVLGVMLFSFIPSFGFAKILPSGFLFSCLSILFSISISLISFLVIGLRKEERNNLLKKIMMKIKVKK